MAEEQSKLEKLVARAEKLKRQIALEKRKDSDKKRKARTHRLIREGGLVEMILGESVDAGLLTGLLESKKSLFDLNNTDNSEVRELKALGDRIIAEHENKEGKNDNDGSRTDGTGA